MDEFRFADQYILNRDTYLNICERIDTANTILRILAKRCDISVHAESPEKCYIRINDKDQEIPIGEYYILKEWLNDK